MVRAWAFDDKVEERICVGYCRINAIICHRFRHHQQTIDISFRVAIPDVSNRANIIQYILLPSCIFIKEQPTCRRYVLYQFFEVCRRLGVAQITMSETSIRSATPNADSVVSITIPNRAVLCCAVRHLNTCAVSIEPPHRGDIILYVCAWSCSSRSYCVRCHRRNTEHFFKQYRIVN